MGQQQWVEAIPPWLAEAADMPKKRIDRWVSVPWEPMLLNTGKTFDAVVVAEGLGTQILRMYHWHCLPPVPAVSNRRTRKIAFLVAPRGAHYFRTLVAELNGEPEYAYRGHDCFVVVPGAQPQEFSQHQWLIPPQPTAPSIGAVATLAGQLVSADEHLAWDYSDEMRAV